MAERVEGARGTVVMFEAPGRLTGLVTDLAEICGDRYVVIAHELTKLHHLVGETRVLLHQVDKQVGVPNDLGQGMPPIRPP